MSEVKERPVLFSSPMVRALLAGTKTQTRRAVKAIGNDDGFVLQDYGDGWWPYRSDDGESAIRSDGTEEPHRCPYGQPGDRLWVRETHYAWGHWTKRINQKKRREEWHFVDETLGAGLSYRYEADEKLLRRKRELHEVGWWNRPAIFMPRAASRIKLEVTEVRVQRLQDISQADATAEGVEPMDSHSSEENDRVDAFHSWLCGNCGGRRLYTSFGPNMGAMPDTDCEKCDTHVKRYRWLWESINGPGSWDANPWVWALTFKRFAP